MGVELVIIIGAAAVLFTSLSRLLKYDSETKESSYKHSAWPFPTGESKELAAKFPFTDKETKPVKKQTAKTNRKNK